MYANNIINTTLNISALTLGTMTFGGQTSQEDSYTIMDLAFEGGITLFDTANIYNQGASETIVGRWLKDRRDRIHLASKVGYQMNGQLSSVNLSRQHIYKALDQTLLRLNTDYLDLYYMHAPDYATPLEESLEAMSELVAKGKVKHLAISNYAAWQVADILSICQERGYTKPIMTQNVYNALSRTIEAELLPCLDAHPMALTVYNPFAAGLLTGKHTSKTPSPNTRLADNPIYKDRYWTDANLGSTAALSEIAQEANMPLTDLAMKFCLANHHVTSVITGVSQPSQLLENLRSIKGPALPGHILDQCDQVWAKHTGKPFAYNR